MYCRGTWLKGVIVLTRGTIIMMRKSMLPAFTCSHSKLNLKIAECPIFPFMFQKCSCKHLFCAQEMNAIWDRVIYSNSYVKM